MKHYKPVKIYQIFRMSSPLAQI